MCAEDKRFESAHEFVNFFLTDRRFRTNNPFTANHVGQSGFIFRGQSCASWPLKPTAFRSDTPMGDFTPQPAGALTDSTNIYQHLGWHLKSEERAVFLFLKNADSVGISTPIDYSNLKNGRDQMHILFSGNVNNDFDCNAPSPIASFQRATALAQHHGVPTRFLDWSESPLVACYFAACGASSFSGSTVRQEQDIAVYFLSSFSLHGDALPVEIISAPRHENSHLLQQQGLFLSFKYANSFFIENRRWSSLGDLPDMRKYLTRVRLPATQADDLLRELFDRNITQLTLMPSLTHAAKAYKNIRALFSRTGSPIESVSNAPTD